MTLQLKLEEAFSNYKLNQAINVGGVSLTYRALHEAANHTARNIIRLEDDGAFIGLLAYRSLHTYIGLAGILLGGKAYLPLNPKFPSDRNMKMLSDARCKSLVVGPECCQVLKDLLEVYDIEMPVLKIIYFRESRNVIATLMKQFARHQYIEADIESADQSTSFPQVSKNDYAYLLFTSGSTGQPKGIGITHENVCAYLDFILSEYDYRPDDRVSQFFDLTFDPSVHDIFSTWLSGGCLYTVPASALLAPARFIKENNLTVWYSVPSVPMFMERLNMLNDNIFPELRFSMFSGEALSQSVAEKWQSAAPNSMVVNYYGPTEATVNITYYNWDYKISAELCRNGGVPLGYPFPEQEIRIIDSDEKTLPPNQRGELIVSGSQVAKSYINNIEKTKASFRPLTEDPDRLWYFTGDMVEQDREGIIYYYGRKDFQVKIRGYRIELPEVEGALRNAAATDFAVVIPWSPNSPEGNTEQLIAVIAGDHDPALIEKVTGVLKSELPPYMVPSDVLFMDTFPLNANGKIDRKVITEFVRTAKEKGVCMYE